MHAQGSHKKEGLIKTTNITEELQDVVSLSSVLNFCKVH